MKKVKGVISCTGATLFLIGMGGLAGACDGEGSFLISAIVFAAGIGLCMAGYMK